MSPIFPLSISRARPRTSSTACVVCVVTAALALTGFRHAPLERSAASRTQGTAHHAGTAHAAAKPAERVELRYTARFAGVGAEGVDNIWVGPLGGPTSGEITLRVEHRGAEADRARPVWPVRVIAFVAADDASASFAADLDGTLDWTTGTMQVSGVVSEGWKAGTPVEQTFRFDPVHLDGEGSLRVGLVTAAQ
jgi:hypothetical protein